jgi:hypothetical protein
MWAFTTIAPVYLQ